MYAMLAARQGVEWKDCKVLAFEFETRAASGMFHNAVMIAELPYISIDCFREYANAIVSKEQDETPFVEAAKRCGGVQIEPNL